jgi:hypothetical protein
MDWISVKERLPDDECLVLVYMPGGWEEVWFGYLSGEDTDTWRLADGGEPAKAITHWMPLPEGPK